MYSNIYITTDFYKKKKQNQGTTEYQIQLI